MQIHHSPQSLPPILFQPNHDPDQFKTPTLQKVEREANVVNDKVKQIAKQSTDKVYEMLHKAVKNTEYNVSFSVDELGTSKQLKLSLKSNGKEVVSLPPDAAVNIAERSKYMSIGLLFDFKA